MATYQSQSENPASPIDLVADSLAFGVAFTLALTIVQRAVGFLRGILFCRMLTDVELGYWSMIDSFLLLLAPLAALGLPGSFPRFVEHYLQKGQVSTFVRRIATLTSAVTLLVAAVMCFFPAWCSKIFFRTDAHTKLVAVMALTLIAVAARNFLVSLVESLRQIRLASIMRFIQGVTFAAFSLLLIAFWQDSVSGAVAGLGISCVLCCLPAFYFLYNKRFALQDTGDVLPSGKMWARIAPFAIWLWASNLVFNMFEVADRYMLVHWSACSAEQASGYVGQYHSARVVPVLLVSVATVLEGIMLPYMTALWEQDEKPKITQQTGRAMKLVAVVATLSALTILAISPFLFGVVFEGRYNDGLGVLPVTLVCSTWFSIYLFGQIYLWVAERGALVFGITAFGLVANLTLNALLIPHFELWGAVLATTIATLLCLIAILWANVATGNRLPVDVFAFCGTPLIVLLPGVPPLASLVALLLLSVFTNVVFSSEERYQIYGKITDVIGRFGRRS